MGELIDLEQVRRGKRLFEIFIQRFGIEHFLALDTGYVPCLDPDRVADAVDLACGWLTKRSERDVSATVQRLLRKRLRRELLQALAEKMVVRGF